jgi:amidase
VDPVDLAFSGLARQAELVRDGEVSSRELTELYLERIARLDPLVRAYRVVLAEEALAAADAADRRRGPDAPALNGVPMAIKDDTDVAGQLTTYGSLGHGGPAPRDSEIVARLRAAGTVVLGMTHVPELQALAATESLAFGATHNPWDLTRTPGGSSGGSGAAVAAGLAAAALGTDGAGSIRIPAACCGLFGLKPQFGRIPVKDSWHGLSAAGAITRGVLDSALFCDAVKEPGPAFAEAARRPPGALRIAFSTKIPRGLIVKLGDEPRAALERTVARLGDLGHTVEERDPEYGMVVPTTTTRYLHAIRTSAAAMPHPERLARRTRGLAAMGGRVPARMTDRAAARADADRERLGAVLRDFDVLLTPVLSHRPPPIGEWDGLPAPLVLNGMAAFTPYLAMWNHTGQPAAAVPVETAPDSFPVAVQLVGRPGDEATLYSLSAQLETATGWLARRPPIAA